MYFGSTLLSRHKTGYLYFFSSNGLVNNADKLAVLYNVITVENVGAENLVSTYSEKLLGLHINADFVWSTHIDKLSIELKKRIGLLRRIKKRVRKEKIVIIAEAIFNSVLRYGVAVFLKNEENRKPKYLQNFDKKRLDMGKHPFILVIAIYFIHFLSFNKSVTCALDNSKYILI